MDDQSYDMVMNLQGMDGRHINITSESNIISKARFAFTSWSEYENGLRPRGSLTLWFTPLFHCQMLG